MIRRAAGKVVTREALQPLLDVLREDGETIVFTNGCFDLLHPGHIHTLESARRFGDLLVVGVNSDASVRRLKGAERPLNPQADRALVLGALECVDYVVVFDEDTPVETIQWVRPHVHVKGADYAGREIPERGAVEQYGGEIRFVPLLEGRSTTAMVVRMRDGG